MLSGVVSAKHSATRTIPENESRAAAPHAHNASYPVCFDGGEGSARLSSSGIEITTEAAGFAAGMTVRIHVLLRNVHAPEVMMQICVSDVERRGGAYLVHARILRVVVENGGLGPHRLPIAKRSDEKSPVR